MTSCNTLRCYLLLLSDVACDENYFFPATNQIKSRAAPQIRVSDASNFVADLKLGCERLIGGERLGSNPIENNVDSAATLRESCLGYASVSALKSGKKLDGDGKDEVG